ncbi:MAG: deoxyribodipyrimidine photo-lyase [Bacteroidales bacterium]|nr:deoxyribodipyrimidine photo-lyase [Bacteroidales bacterium]
MKEPINIFWFRRDLRLNDNAGLFHALQSRRPVLPLFIFDANILNDLHQEDTRVAIIHQSLQQINEKLITIGSRLVVKNGKPIEIWKELINDYYIIAVFTNHDYEPYALQRDREVEKLLKSKGIEFHTFKDQVIFEKNEVVKDGGKPYTVYTPYMRKWMARFEREGVKVYETEKYFEHFLKLPSGQIQTLKDTGFVKSKLSLPGYNLEADRIENYENTRNYPALERTTQVGPYLRFGIISIRELVLKVKDFNPTYMKELVWREFFMQILYHFPQVVEKSFKPAYDNIRWINDEAQFKRWCEGTTGFPMVDAGMRELNQTGYMHNRVRMVVASFLCKHLLIDWRWGEAYFAKKLLDYELSSNNGNWQWAAGSGCDAAPYFRVFNPTEQVKKFDPDLKYIHKRIPELNTPDYPEPIIDHKFARERAIKVYKDALS